MQSRTLNLDGIIPALEEDTELYEQLDQRALSFIKNIGLELPAQPMVDGKPLIPRLPEGPNGPTLDQLDQRGLSNLYVKLLAYFQYATSQLGILKVQEIALKQQHKLTETKILLLLPPPEGSKKTRARGDRRLTKIDGELIEVQARKELLSNIVSSAEAEMTVISREVSIRKEEMECIRRADNIDRDKRGGSRLPAGRQPR